MRKLLFSTVAALVVAVAASMANCASYVFAYQPKEPKSLKK